MEMVGLFNKQSKWLKKSIILVFLGTLLFNSTIIISHTDTIAHRIVQDQKKNSLKIAVAKFLQKSAEAIKNQKLKVVHGAQISGAALRNLLKNSALLIKNILSFLLTESNAPQVDKPVVKQEAPQKVNVGHSKKVVQPNAPEQTPQFSPKQRHNPGRHHHRERPRFGDNSSLKQKDLHELGSQPASAAIQAKVHGYLKALGHSNADSVPVYRLNMHDAKTHNSIAGMTTFWAIWINEDSADEIMLNETCAHEATHYYKGHCTDTTKSQAQHEFEADEGAFHLLTPLERTKIYVRCLYAKFKKLPQKLQDFLPGVVHFFPSGEHTDNFITLGNNHPHLLMA